MTERPIGVSDVATGAGVADYRTRERSVGGNTVAEQYLIPVEDRVILWRGSVSTFRASAAVSNDPHTFASLWNPAGSGTILAVRRITAQNDMGATTSIRQNKLVRFTVAPTGGTLQTPVSWDTSLTPTSAVEFRGWASADGTLTAITTTPTPANSVQAAWGSLGEHAITTTEAQVRGADLVVWPIINSDSIIATNDIILLRAGEGIGVQSAGSGGVSNAQNQFINMSWEEVSFP